MTNIENQLIQIISSEKNYFDNSKINNTNSIFDILKKDNSGQNIAKSIQHKNLKPFSSILSFLELKDIFSLKSTSRRIYHEVDMVILKEYAKNVFMRSKLISEINTRDYLWNKFLGVDK
jgi:hypothetical protein